MKFVSILYGRDSLELLKFPVKVGNILKTTKL